MKLANVGFTKYNWRECLSRDGINQEHHIQDIIVIITLVLEGDYSTVADMNEDGTINILDVVLVALIILNPEP